VPLQQDQELRGTTSSKSRRGADQMDSSVQDGGSTEVVIKFPICIAIYIDDQIRPDGCKHYAKLEIVSGR
jgi:hypothetical protein